MSELIEREYLVDHIHACMGNDRLMKTATKEEILQMIADTPTIDPDRNKGHWINEGRFANYHGGNVYRCSWCGNRIIENEPDDFCKYCGSDNRGGRS